MSSVQPIFDPATYAKVRQPLEQANHLPPWCYTSDAFYEREVGRIFMKEWNFMGRADHLGAPGAYTALDFAGIPLVILRDSEGGLRAFANNCPHRGASLLAGEGQVRRIGCPYHAWTVSTASRWGTTASSPYASRPGRASCSSTSMLTRPAYWIISAT